MKDLVSTNEKIRFVINGVIATSIHFLVLYLCVDFLKIAYYGISNFIGAILGTSYSFLGNKFFVFKNSNNNILVQSYKFILLYTCMAINHGIFLYIWSDICDYNYMLGFFLITIVNTILSFFINKYKIFV